MGRVVGQKMSRAGGLDSGGTGGASYALEDALDEPFIESDANSDGEPAEAGRSAEQTMIGGISGLELSDASSLAVGQVVDDLPSGCTRRTSQQHAHLESSLPVEGVAGQRTAHEPPGDVAVDPGPREPVGLELLHKRAFGKFCGGRESSVVVVGDTCASETTLELLVLAKSVITSLFNDHGDKICSSPARPDLRLSQEEALGHLVAEIIIGNLLASEAPPIGKRIDNYASTEKKTQAKEKEAARSAKRSLRKKKGADTDLQLDSKCAAIDEALMAARVARLSKVIDIGMPPKNSKIVAKSMPSCMQCTGACRCHDICTHGKELLEMARSPDAADAIAAAYHVAGCSRAAEREEVLELDEELDHLQVTYKHALRRLVRAYPESEFSRWDASSADDMVEWTIRLTALGQAIPAAVAAAQEVGFNLEKAAVMCRAQWD